MRPLLALALLLSTVPNAPASGDEVETARNDLVNAFRACDRVAAARASAALLRLNAETCPEAFAAAFHSGFEVYAEVEKEQKKWAKEMDANALYRDNDNRVVSKGEVAKYYAAKKNYDAVTPKVEALNSALPRSMAQLARLSGPGAAKGLVAVLRGSPDWLPRAASAEALSKIDDPAALEALLVRAKAEDNAAAKVAIADALGWKAKESEEARKLLTAWLEGPYWQVRLAAAQGLARSGDKKSVPALIAQLQKVQGRLRHELNECLKTLTGVNKHADFGAWKAWWEKNNEQVLDGTYTVRPFEQADERGLTSFYGVAFHSSKVVFVLDISNSMAESAKWKPDAAGDDKPESDHRIDIAKYELRKIVRTIPDSAGFNLIAFSARLFLLGEQMVVAGKPTRETALKFVQGIKVGVGTDLFGALNRALDFAGGGWNAPLRQDSVDTIYLISDGVPTFGLVDRDLLVERTLDNVRYKKIVIHSIAIDPPREGKPVMKGLAEGTGGQYLER